MKGGGKVVKVVSDGRIIISATKQEALLLVLLLCRSKIQGIIEVKVVGIILEINIKGKTPERLLRK